MAQAGSVDRMNLLGNRNLLVVLVAIVLMELVHGVEVIALLPLYFRQELDLSVGFIGIVISTYMVADVATRTPAGWLADRFGRKPVLLLGVAISAAVIPAMMRTGSPELLIALNFLNGVGAGAIWPSIYAIVADTFGPERRGVVLGLLNMVMLGGLASGPITGNFIIGWTSYAATFAFCLVLVLGAGVVVAVGLRETLAKESSTVSGPSFGLSWWSPGLILLGFIALTITMALATLLPVIELYGQEILGVSKMELGLILLVPGLITAAALVPAGHLADRSGRKGPMVLGTALIAFCLWGTPLSINPFVVAFGGAVAGVGYALVAPSWNALMMDKIPKEARGLLLGSVAAIQGAGMAIGPILGGFLWELVHPFAPFLAAAALLSLTTIAVLCVKE